MGTDGRQGKQIAILGAGPVGLEVALAVGEAGYDFTLYEAADSVAGNVRDWGHVQLFTPWSMNVSPRMGRALSAAGREVPEGEECPTGGELAARLLEPVAELPQVAPHLRLGTRVVAVGRQGLLKQEEIASERRAGQPFRLLLRGAGGEQVEHADAVVDCSGSYALPNALGDGGIPAPGEEALADRIAHRLPDLDDPVEAGRWAGRTVLLVGAGHSAQTAARDLAALAEKAPGTRLFWALRSAEPHFAVAEDDPLVARAELARRAEELVAGESPAVEARTGVVVESLAPGADGQVAVTLRRVDGGREELQVDRLLALTGSVGDASLYRQLQIHECYATAAPMKLAAALLGDASGDCLAQQSHGAETLRNPEPGFFILGSKSYGRNATFLLRVGWQQADDLVALLSG